jgi:sulfide:quinone oxidoreductase
MGASAQPGRRPRVLIAGGGVAAIEASLALRDLAGKRLEVELWAPCDEFAYRPFALGESWDSVDISRYDLDSLLRRVGVSFRRDGIFSVDSDAGLAMAGEGRQIPYDYLLVATGARMLWAVPGAATFWGAADEGGFGGLMRRLRRGILRDVAFTMPSGQSWGLPVYELALLASTALAKCGIGDAGLVVVTPEDAPLEAFGRVVAEQMAQLLREHRIEVVTGVHPLGFEDGHLRVVPGESIATDAVVSLPRLEGHRIDGLPFGLDGFLPVDRHCGVVGVERVFAAGDVTSFPVKQGGIATQGADAAAEAIAAAAGCAVEPAPFDPVLPADTGREVVGRYLTPFLAGLSAREEPIAVAG